ncbi:ComF family protein [Haliovirga abyssi]|uniref:Amidophosphoribosyltransferase n=1 Tax=Haliovirga abyssi TaxID=2996794 RepID=A0AAU9D4W5_9FUSO|nr:phosphoribosyltransferase family protein [Haliovirga abyssi]BDU51086.1 amidophosphoribosyltransferase [Haliovirga abyssi]
MQNLFLNIKKIIFSEKCVVCNRKVDDTRKYLCYNCYKEFYYKSSLKKIDNLYYFWHYDENHKKILLNYKFVGIKSISEIISGIIKEKVNYLLDKENIDEIISVPININRKRKRGFNQVDLILDKLKLDYIKIKRIKNTKSMYKILNENKRKENIKNSFKIDKNLDLNNKNILIVDDVITTGSTLKEIEKNIRKLYKPNKIIYLTLFVAKYYRKRVMENGI